MKPEPLLRLRPIEQHERPMVDDPPKRDWGEVAVEIMAILILVALGGWLYGV